MRSTSRRKKNSSSSSEQQRHHIVISSDDEKAEKAEKTEKEEKEEEPAFVAEQTPEERQRNSTMEFIQEHMTIMQTLSRARHHQMKTAEEGEMNRAVKNIPCEKRAFDAKTHFVTQARCISSSEVIPVGRLRDYRMLTDTRITDPLSAAQAFSYNPEKYATVVCRPTDDDDDSSGASTKKQRSSSSSSSSSPWACQYAIEFDAREALTDLEGMLQRKQAEYLQAQREKRRRAQAAEEEGGDGDDVSTARAMAMHRDLVNFPNPVYAMLVASVGKDFADRMGLAQFASMQMHEYLTWFVSLIDSGTIVVGGNKIGGSDEDESGGSTTTSGSDSGEIDIGDSDRFRRHDNRKETNTQEDWTQDKNLRMTLENVVYPQLCLNEDELEARDKRKKQHHQKRKQSGGVVGRVLGGLRDAANWMWSSGLASIGRVLRKGFHYFLSWIQSSTILSSLFFVISSAIRTALCLWIQGVTLDDMFIKLVERAFGKNQSAPVRAMVHLIRYTIMLLNGDVAGAQRLLQKDYSNMPAFKEVWKIPLTLFSMSSYIYKIVSGLADDVGKSILAKILPPLKKLKTIPWDDLISYILIFWKMPWEKQTSETLQNTIDTNTIWDTVNFVGIQVGLIPEPPKNLDYEQLKSTAIDAWGSGRWMTTVLAGALPWMIGLHILHYMPKGWFVQLVKTTMRTWRLGGRAARGARDLITHTTHGPAMQVGGAVGGAITTAMFGPVASKAGASVGATVATTTASGLAWYGEREARHRLGIPRWSVYLTDEMIDHAARYCANAAEFLKWFMRAIESQSASVTHLAAILSVLDWFMMLMHCWIMDRIRQYRSGEKLPDDKRGECCVTNAVSDLKKFFFV